MTQPPYNPSGAGGNSNWQPQPTDASTQSGAQPGSHTDYGQPSYSQPGYSQYSQQPYGAGAGQYGGQMSGGYMPPPKAQGITITAMILGIISVFFGALPVFGLLLGAAAVIVSAVALSKKVHSKGMSIAGLITGLIGLAIGLMMTILLFTGLSLVERVVNDPSFQQEFERELKDMDQGGSVGGNVKKNDDNNDRSYVRYAPDGSKGIDLEEYTRQNPDSGQEDARRKLEELRRSQP